MATKRKNPFIEEVPRQMKVYVGPKQVAGVEEMKKVHDHTKYLLFKGSNPDASNEALQSVGCASNGFHGHSVHPNASKENVVPKCHQCCCVLPSIMFKCRDCDRMLCVHCSRECVVCRGGCCCYCSVLNYDSPEVRTVCLHCLPLLTNH